MRDEILIIGLYLHNNEATDRKKIYILLVNIRPLVRYLNQNDDYRYLERTSS